MDTQVTHLSHLTQRAHEYFPDHVGVTFDALVEPVDATLPAGRSLRGGTVFTTIEEARRQDDDSVPMGAWEHELKRADWDKVTAVAVDALRHKSKDLQLAAWLFEAQVTKNGFAAIAPCLMLMHALLARYWTDLHPQIEDEDLDFRGNILRWAGEKLLPTVRLIPLTGCGRDSEYNWTDWERALRNEQFRATRDGRDDSGGAEGITLAQLAGAMTATSTNAYAWLAETMVEGLVAIRLLTEAMDERFGADAPGFGKLSQLLEQILGLAESELRKRGVLATAAQDDAVEEEPQPAVPHGADAGAPAHGAQGVIRNRLDAYTRLAEAADFLMRADPHSPSPYLINRAIEWGRMNTADLYQELFIKLDGKLDIFELLGLKATGQGEHG